MTYPYVHTKTFAPASSYSFTTTQGKGAEVRIPSRLNLSDYALVMLYDTNSRFQNAQQIGQVVYTGGQLLLSLTADEVNAIKDAFYRIRVDRPDGSSFALVEGSIDYRSLAEVEDSEGILDSQGQIKVQYLPALYNALAVEFLRRDEYVAGVVDPAVLDQAVVTKLAEHVNSATPHPAYDIDAPEFKLIFENGLI